MLTPQEADSLFETLRTMAAEGRTVIFISHKLHEVKAVSDNVTVLRGGKTVATVDDRDSTPHSLAELMVGRELEVAPRSSGVAAGRSRARARGRGSPGDRGETAVRGVTFDVRAGEIVAVAGVAGNGQRELAEVVAGMRGLARGACSSAAALRGGDARESIRAGVAHVPEDRLHRARAEPQRRRNVVLKTYRHRGSRSGRCSRSGAIRERAVGSSGATT